MTILRTNERSEWPAARTLSYLDIAKSSYYRWCRELRSGNLQDNRGKAPCLDRILAEEEQAVIDYALAHPQEGYRRLAWMMIDENVVCLSPSTVYRILDKHDLLYRWKKSVAVGNIPAKPKAPDVRWHTDILYLWVAGRWYFLVTVIDGYSRYIVNWKLLFSMVADDVVSVIEEALENIQAHPQVVSDNGPQFISREFRQLIKQHTLVDIKTMRRHPESNGLIERYHRTFREEGIGDQLLPNYYDACELITKWVYYYNNHRLHSAIEYLRPIDYYRGEPEKLVKERLEKLEKARQLRRKINQQRLKKAA